MYLLTLNGALIARSVTRPVYDTARRAWATDDALHADSSHEMTVTTEIVAAAGVVVTMRQARLALLAAGKLEDVGAAIAAIPDAIARQAAQIEWDYAHEVHRTSPFVQQLGAALGLDDAGLDALFAQAVAL